MRYRRMPYRYAVVFTTEQPLPIGEGWRAERDVVTLARPAWRPRSDVYETADSVLVTVEVAGVDTEDMEIQLFEDALVVDGHRRIPVVDSSGVYHAAEIRRGPFRLEIALPAAIDPERAEAQYDRGFLQMTLVKAGRDGDGR